MVNVLYDPVAHGVISSPIAGETVAFILAGLLLILVVGIALTADRDALPTQVHDAARRINAAIRESMERFPGAWRGTPGHESGHFFTSGVS